MSAGRAIDLLAPLGVAVAAGAGIASRYGVTLPGGLNTWLAVGAALVLTHLLLRWESIARAIGGRQLRHGSNSALLILVVLGILVGLNYIAFRRPLKKDFTKGQRYSLSDQTTKVVGGLQDDIRILYFQRAAELAGGDERIKQYQALSPHVKAEFVDPYAKPARAREYDVKGPWPIIVIERGTRRERAASDSEQDLTNAVVKVTREGQKTVCFVEGEGERDVDDGSDLGFTGAREALTKSQYVTKKVVLARERTVPADCSVLVVAGPQADLLPPVAEAVRAYVAAGGKALILAEPPLKKATPNLDGMLRGWNLEPGDDVVVDVSGMGQLFGAGELTPMAVEYPFHEITKGFRVMTAFHEARSLQAGTAPAPGITAQNLVQTSEASWAESDLGLKAPVQADAKDKKGPIALGAVATVPVAAPPSPMPPPEASPSPGASPSPEASPEATPPAREGRVVAIGDADFASNALLGFQGNRDFFLNAVAWLAEDADLIAIRPREPEDQRMFLTQTQQQSIAFVALLLLPGLFVALGVWTWWTRR
jgi:gliding motility-associatede transport system auxiliary component